MKDFIRLDFKALDPYQRFAYKEMMQWCTKTNKNPGWINTLTSGFQQKFNKFIPAKVHKAIDKTIKEMIQFLMMGTRFIAPAPQQLQHLKLIEDKVAVRISNHKWTATAEGGLTGAGGFLWSLADFPLLLGIKIKLLQDIAAFFGMDGKDPNEKVFLLLVLQVAFSSDKIRKETLHKIIHFEAAKQQWQLHPDDVDWHTLQQQYRDYLDIAKLLQMMPLIGAAVGSWANYRLMKRLGHFALQCYRIRYFQAYGQQQLAGASTEISRPS